MSETLKKYSKIFKALSDENRLAILTLIYKREHLRKKVEEKCEQATCIKDISKELNITTATISHHIKELVNAGIISTSKNGKWVYCQIDNKTIAGLGKYLLEFVR